MAEYESLVGLSVQPPLCQLQCKLFQEFIGMIVLIPLAGDHLKATVFILCIVSFSLLGESRIHRLISSHEGTALSIRHNLIQSLSISYYAHSSIPTFIHLKFLNELHHTMQTQLCLGLLRMQCPVRCAVLSLG